MQLVRDLPVAVSFYWNEVPKHFARSSNRNCSSPNCARASPSYVGQTMPCTRSAQIKSATELLEAYLDNVRTPKVSASQFAEDGVLELPWVKAHARGPAEVENLLTGLLAKIPDFRFKNCTWTLSKPPTR